MFVYKDSSSQIVLAIVKMTEKCKWLKNASKFGKSFSEKKIFINIYILLPK